VSFRDIVPQEAVCGRETVLDGMDCDFGSLLLAASAVLASVSPYSVASRADTDCCPASPLAVVGALCGWAGLEALAGASVVLPCCIGGVGCPGTAALGRVAPVGAGVGKAVRLGHFLEPSVADCSGGVGHQDTAFGLVPGAVPGSFHHWIVPITEQPPDNLGTFWSDS